MSTWYLSGLIKYGNHKQKKAKGIGFQQNLNGVWCLKAHTTDEMKAVLSVNSTNLIMVSPGCTSRCQPLDACVDTPSKCVLRICWEDCIADIVTNLSEEE